jgi:50S ribosomal subunit-associated GTPase HflX
MTNATSRNVLREIGAEVVPSRLLFNKIDRVSESRSSNRTHEVARVLRRRAMAARVVSAQAYPSRPCADGAQTQTKWHTHIWRIVHG